MEARDKWGRSPLHWTILNGFSAAARLLVEQGAELEPKQQPRRVQRRRTSLVQPPSLRTLAREMHPPHHPIHTIFGEEREQRGERGRDEADVSPPSSSPASSAPPGEK
eukprot:761544-Hanusia_phi.AAC.1